jgi:hypothetical protein
VCHSPTHSLIHFMLTCIDSKALTYPRIYPLSHLPTHLFTDDIIILLINAFLYTLTHLLTYPHIATAYDEIIKDVLQAGRRRRLSHSLTHSLSGCSKKVTPTKARVSCVPKSYIPPKKQDSHRRR